MQLINTQKTLDSAFKELFNDVLIFEIR